MPRAKGETGSRLSGMTMMEAARSLHVAIIMDGNGRWARAGAVRATAGHVAGAEAVRRAVEAAPAAGDRDADPVRLLFGQLAAPAGRGRIADAPVPPLPDERGGSLRARTACASRSSAGATGCRRALLRAIQEAESMTAAGVRGPPADRHRLFGPRRHREGGRPSPPHERQRSGDLARDLFKAPGRSASRRPGAGRGPPDPHRRRAAALGLPALGVRLRRAGLHRAHVARLREGRPGGGGAGLRAAGEKVRAGGSSPPDPLSHRSPIPGRGGIPSQRQ